MASSSASTPTMLDSDSDAVIIVGAGLAGLTAAYEITQAGKPVVIVDQEPEVALGGQAWWSLGGIFLVDSPEQRRVGVRDSLDLARRDWFNSARFDRPDFEDKWAIRWAEAYLQFAAGKGEAGMHSYLANRGVGYVPTIGWAERGGGGASDHGNSVPRFHVTWGTGPEVVRAFRDPVLEAAKKGLVQFKYRHQVDELVLDAEGKSVIGVKGTVLEPSSIERGQQSSRKGVGQFELRGRAVLISTGGIGGSPALIRKLWPTQSLGPCPKKLVLGVPHHVDGRMLEISEKAGANLVNKDRLWFYTEGMTNWDPIWPDHAIRCITGPSALWLTATGERFPAPLVPGSDTIRSFKHILATGYDYSWFVLTKSILDKEVMLSGSEQNPDLTNKSVWQVIKRMLYGQEPVMNFMRYGEDFVVASNLPDLVDGMNKLVGSSDRGPKAPLEYDAIEKTVTDRDSQFANPYSKDAQLMLVNNARLYWPERLGRVAKPHRLLDPAHGPLIAIRMNLITRKTLGGVQTNLQSQVMSTDGETPIGGLYAAGELAGFGGGGVMGYNALEGTFLTGCVFSGRAAGLAMAKL